MPQLKPGDRAPAFDLPDQHGKRVTLADFRGRRLLVYFYPKADTPGCTKQACSIRDHRQDLAGLGLAVVGISPDSPEAQRRFDEKYALGFPLLSDPEHRTAEAYGVWGEKRMYGKTVRGIIRSAFLIDESGKAAHVWYRVKPEETVLKVQQALQS
jgi:thioredoxin-dependent peroxiredoxin